MEQITEFNQLTAEYAKTFTNEYGTCGILGKFTEKLDTYLNAVNYIELLNATQYNTNDFESKGSDALDFIKKADLIYKTNLELGKGFGVTVPNTYLKNFLSSDEDVNKLSTSIISTLYKSLEEETLKNLLDVLEENTFTAHDYIKYDTIDKNKLNALTVIEKLIDFKSFSNEHINFNTNYNILISNENYKLILKNLKSQFDTQIYDYITKNINFIIISSNYVKIENFIYIFSDEALKILNQYEDLGSIENPKYGFTNYFLRVKQSIYINPRLKIKALKIE